MPSPTSLSSVRADAIARRDRGDLHSARDLLERALEAATMTSGEDHPEVLTTAHLLATLHRQAGDLSGARRVLENALYAGSSRHGDDHPLLLSISYDLAEIADELGNRHEARRHYTRVARYGPAAPGFNQQQVQAARAWLGPNAPAAAGIQAAPVTVPAPEPIVAPPAPPQTPPGEWPPKADVPPQFGPDGLPIFSPSAGTFGGDHAGTGSSGSPSSGAGPTAQSGAPAQPGAPAQSGPASPAPAKSPAQPAAHTAPAPPAAPASPAPSAAQAGPPPAAQAGPPPPAPTRTASPPAPPPAGQTAPPPTAPPTQPPAPPPAGQPAPPPRTAPPVSPAQGMPMRHGQPGQAHPMPPAAQAGRPGMVAPGMPAGVAGPSGAQRPGPFPPAIGGPPVSPGSGGYPPNQTMHPMALGAPLSVPPPARPRRGTGVLIASIAAAIVAIAAASVTTFLVLRSDDSPGETAIEAPSNVAIQVKDDRVTITWTDPSNGVAQPVIVGNREGEGSRRFAMPPNGATEASITGLNKKYDYCFSVMLVYTIEEFKQSDQVCTNRNKSTSSTTG